MKTSTIISELSIEDLVELFSKALRNDDMFFAYWDTLKRYDGVVFERDDAYELKLAKLLFHGGTVNFYDRQAGWAIFGEKGIYDKSQDPDKEGIIKYPLKLDDIRRGLSNIADGDFKCDGEHKVIALEYLGYFRHFRDYFDETAAETLLQIIIFGEWVYN